MKTRGGRALSGFTLIELMVAMAALAAISAMTWTAVDAMSNAVEASRSKSEALLSLSRASESLRKDLTAARCPWAPPPGAPTGPGSRAPGPSNDGLPPAVGSWDQERLLLTVEGGSGGAQVVAWSPKPGGLTRLAMAPSPDMASWRQAWSQAEAWASDPEAAVPELAEASAHAGASGIAGAEFRFDASWSQQFPAAACPLTNLPGLVAPALMGAHVALSPSPDTGLAGPLAISWASPLLPGAKP